MPSTSIKKEIPCSKENLIKMVLDIEKYPEFVPWCLNGKIHRKNDKGDRIEIRNFGTFSTRKREKRISRNPKTVTSVLVEEKSHPYFRASKNLKNSLNK